MKAKQVTFVDEYCNTKFGLLIDDKVIEITSGAIYGPEEYVLTAVNNSWEWLDYEDAYFKPFYGNKHVNTEFTGQSKN